MKNLIIRLVTAAAFVLLAAQPAMAQDASARFLPTPAPDAAADEVLSLVTENMVMARDEAGQLLPPLSEADRARPLLDRDAVREIMDLGVASGIGQACGLDWRTLNFLPLMARERGRNRTPHQLAAVAMIHGAVQGSIATRIACGPSGASDATSFYLRKWGAQAPATP